MPLTLISFSQIAQLIWPALKRAIGSWFISFTSGDSVCCRALLGMEEKGGVALLPAGISSGLVSVRPLRPASVWALLLVFGPGVAMLQYRKCWPAGPARVKWEISDKRPLS